METSTRTQQCTSNDSSAIVNTGFIDGLLWIGGSYKEIECLSDRNCAVPSGARCFVHEAEWRGISRKVSHVHRWAVPGKSKIFLVHRGGCKARYEGKIFGYFHLARVEVLSAFKHPASSPDVDEELAWSSLPGEGRLTVTVYDSLSGRQLRGAEVKAWGGTQPSYKRGIEKKGRYILDLCSGECSLEVSIKAYGTASLEGVRVPDGKRRNLHLYLNPEPKKAKERKKTCWNGEEVITHTFEEGQWKPTGKDCPDPPEP